MDQDPFLKKKYTPQQARQKAEHYCAYQERSQQEVRDKLYEWGLHQKDVEQIISELISDNFLNEQRFAAAYSLGKFRMKNWGKIRIKQGLKLKRVPDKMIKKALDGIDFEEYSDALRSILIKKSSLIRDNDKLKRLATLHRYGISKGYESELILHILREIEPNK